MWLLKPALHVHRILRKPPGYIARRVLQEAECELERWLAPQRARSLGRDRLLTMARASSVDELWTRLRARPFPAVTARAPSSAVVMAPEAIWVAVIVSAWIIAATIVPGRISSVFGAYDVATSPSSN